MVVHNTAQHLIQISQTIFPNIIARFFIIQFTYRPFVYENNTYFFIIMLSQLPLSLVNFFFALKTRNLRKKVINGNYMFA